MEKLNPDKGQHILINKDVLKQEIEASKLTKKDKVIEVGAGTGNLTRELAKKAGKVLAFEIDSQFMNQLDKLKSENLQVEYGDALNADWRGYNKLISNIPYFLAESVLEKAAASGIKTLVMITGENFKRLLEEDSKSGIIARLFYDITPLAEISPENFNPMPRVNSWLIKLQARNSKDKSEEILREIIIREGKIKNAIIHTMQSRNKTKNQAREIIEKMNLDKFVLEKPVKMITAKFILRLKQELDKLEI